MLGKNLRALYSKVVKYPQKMQCEEGTEFQKIPKDLTKKYNFTVFQTFNREIKASHAERFIQTLKTMISRTLNIVKSKRVKKSIITNNFYLGFLRNITTLHTGGYTN